MERVKVNSEQSWWMNGLIYHLYIKSFCDSNADGIGDIRGVLEQLDYLEGLGIDAIWLSPFYQSPMKDNGYDVSDYYHVNPMFGTDDDLTELFDEMKKRKIKIIIDLILNHTSNQHKWFLKALEDPFSKYRDYYIFKNQNEINNARAIFGGSAWEQVEDGSYYYHTFAKEQPDLNWENPELRQDIYRMINSWLDKGVDGFRLDAITFLKKNQLFPSLPADGSDGLFDCPKISINQPGLLDYLMELKENTWGGKNIYTVGEAPGVSLEELPKFISENGVLSSVFDFAYNDIDVTGVEWSIGHDWNFTEFQNKLNETQKSTQMVGEPCTYLENHDNPRSINKFLQVNKIEESLRFYMSTALHMFFLFLKGTAYLYQGQELGMSNVKFKSIDEVEDINTIDQYHRVLSKGNPLEDAIKMINRRSRDHSRFFVNWNSKTLDANKHKNDTVAQQLEDENSILAFVKSLIKLRKSDRLNNFLQTSMFEEEPHQIDGLVAYNRVLRNQKLTVLTNMTAKKLFVGNKSGSVLKSNYLKVEFTGTLEAYEAVILVTEL